MYSVPEFIMGMPLYKLSNCINFIAERLEKDGLKFKFLIQIYCTFLGKEKKMKMNNNLKTNFKLLLMSNHIDKLKRYSMIEDRTNSWKALHKVMTNKSFNRRIKNIKTVKKVI